MDRQITKEILRRLSVRYPDDHDLTWLLEEHEKNCFHGEGALLEEYWRRGLADSELFQDFCDSFEISYMCCPTRTEFSEFDFFVDRRNESKVPVCPHCRVSVLDPNYDQRHYPVFNFILNPEKPHEHKRAQAEKSSEQQPDRTYSGPA